MSKIENMVIAYLEAIYFTETGDVDQPSQNAELAYPCRGKAYIDCTNFLRAIGSSTEGAVKDFDSLSPSQLGHDLWLTRNGHGSGFWDRDPSIYSSTNATLFTRIAIAMGEHTAEFLE